jgi:hypothetical protein
MVFGPRYHVPMMDTQSDINDDFEAKNQLARMPEGCGPLLSKRARRMRLLRAMHAWYFLEVSSVIVLPIAYILAPTRSCSFASSHS